MYSPMEKKNVDNAPARFDLYQTTRYYVCPSVST
jgi:hypothetical protein